MVEKRARRALDILDIPFPLLVPELAMTPADDFAFETHRGCRRSIHGDRRMVFSLGITADFDGLFASRQGAGHWRKGQ